GTVLERQDRDRGDAWARLQAAPGSGGVPVRGRASAVVSARVGHTDDYPVIVSTAVRDCSPSLAKTATDSVQSFARNPICAVRAPAAITIGTVSKIFHVFGGS